MQYLSACFVFQVIILLVASKSLPSYIHKCKKSAPKEEISECIKQNAILLLPRLKNGLPELKLPPIEPLKISKLEVSTGSSSSGFTASFNDISVYGIANTEVKEFVCDLSKPFMSLYAYIPRLQIEAQFQLRGKISLLDLHSTGLGYINITDVYTKTHHPRVSYVEKKNKTYFNLGDDEIDSIKYHMEGMYLNDIIRGNPPLTAEINRIMNENYDDISKDLDPVIFEATRSLLLGTIKPLFDTYSVDELFLP